FVPAGRIHSIPTKRRALVVLLLEIRAAFETDRIYSEKQVKTILAEFHPGFARLLRELLAHRPPRRDPHPGPDWGRPTPPPPPGRVPPGLRAPATRTERLPAARPRLPPGPVLGESEPTYSHRFPSTGDGRAHGVSALTPRRRILGARANTGQTEGAFMAYHADSSDLDEKEILTWDLFGQSARELAQTIADSDYDPEIVIAVARGGLLPAGALAYALGLKLSDAINVEFYTDVHETLPDPILLAPMLDIDAIKGKKLLVV